MFYSMEWEAEYFSMELYPFFNLIVTRPMCDSEWSLLCHSILAFCFTSLFLLCKNMTYFSLCTDYFVWVTCTEIKWTESTVDTFFFLFFSLIVITAFHLFFPLILSRTHFINLKCSLSPHSIIQLVNLQRRRYAGCFCCYLLSICRVSQSKLAIVLTAWQRGVLVLVMLFWHDFTCRTSLTNTAAGLL